MGVDLSGRNFAKTIANDSGESGLTPFLRLTAIGRAGYTLLFYLSL
jgi:hypothetical protein